MSSGRRRQQPRAPRRCCRACAQLAASTCRCLQRALAPPRPGFLLEFKWSLYPGHHSVRISRAVRSRRQACRLAVALLCCAAAPQRPLRLPPSPAQEKGYNGVWLNQVRDCWVRDIRTIHADSTVLTQGARGRS